MKTPRHALDPLNPFLHILCENKGLKTYHDDMVEEMADLATLSSEKLPDTHPPPVAKNIFSASIKMEDPRSVASSADEVFETPDMSVVKNEVFDLNVLMWLITEAHREGKVSDDEKDRLRKYYKKARNGNQVETYYVLGKKCKSEFIGRWCIKQGLGLQGFRREIRNALSRKFYWDIDMENAQPTILLQICQRNGWACEKLKFYCDNRKEILQQLVEHLKTDRDDAKQRITALLFGNMTISDLTTFIKDELFPELRLHMKNVMVAYPKETAYVKRTKEPNVAGKVLSAVLQTEERKCLMALDRSLTKLGRRLDVLIHDGGLVRKLENEEAFDEAILRQAEADIKAIAGYDVKLAVKPMVDVLEMPEVKDDYVAKFVKRSQYETMKAEFEQNHFYLIDKNKICEEREEDDKIFFFEDMRHAKDTFITKYAWRQYNEEKREEEIVEFLDLWIKDAKRRTINKLVFKPKVEDVKEGEYNLWSGFKGANTDAPTTEANILDKYFYHLKLLANYDCGENSKEQNKCIYEYIINWISHMLQKPYELPNVMLIFTGEEGTGKSKLWEFIGEKVVGREMYFKSRNPELEVFGDHATIIQGKLLCQFEEMGAFEARKNANKLKAMITDNVETINPKGVGMYRIDNNKRYVGTTNEKTPIKADGKARRYLISYVSDAKVADKDHKENYAFWADMVKYYERPEVARAVYDFHMSQDISNIVIGDRPETEYVEMLKEHEKPYEVQFIEEWDGNFSRWHTDDEKKEGKASELYDRYKDWCVEKHIANTLTLNHFGRLLTPLVAQGKLTRRVLGGVSIYKKV